jgi:phosphoenolpyruvate synthase/pyruvate phosphate dikinase
MPEQIEADLRAFLKSVRSPLSVRSSSLLEDAHHHPLVGLYKTFMVPNDHPDDAVRLAQLTTAIKQVYASAWFEEPRRFAMSTAFRHRKEQMAVLIQQIVGSAQG